MVGWLSGGSPIEVTDDPPLRQSTHVCKSTKLLDFVYSTYSSSFTSFIASIHRLSKPSSLRSYL